MSKKTKCKSKNGLKLNVNLKCQKTERLSNK